MQGNNKKEMSPSAQEVARILTKHRFVLSNEKTLQMEIEKLFVDNSLVFRREYFLDVSKHNIVDFMVKGGIGIEVKLRCNKRAIYEQLLRYSQFEEVQELILVTATNTGMPTELNGKPVRIINISRAWL